MKRINSLLPSGVMYGDIDLGQYWLAVAWRHQSHHMNNVNSSPRYSMQRI